MRSFPATLETIPGGGQMSDVVRFLTLGVSVRGSSFCKIIARSQGTKNIMSAGKSGSFVI